MGREENRLGLLGATVYIVGTIVGSGIFVAPKGILYYAGSVGLSLVIWVVSALLAMLTAINYVELGSSIYPESGAELAYISFMGWAPIAFSFLRLTSVIESGCSGSVLFLTFGQYLVEALDPLFCLSPPDLVYSAIPPTPSRVMLFPTHIGSRVSWFWPFIKEHGHMQAIQFLNYGLEDIKAKNFKKTFPRAVIGGLALSSLIYILVNIAYFSVLSPEDILCSDAVATLFIQKTLGQKAAYAMPALVGLLVIGSLNSDIFSWSRFILAGARKGLMPTAFALVHPVNDSPRVAVVFHVRNI